MGCRCPNLSTLVGHVVAQRLIALAGGSVAKLSALKGNVLRHLGEATVASPILSSASTVSVGGRRAEGELAATGAVVVVSRSSLPRGGAADDDDSLRRPLGVEGMEERGGAATVAFDASAFLDEHVRRHSAEADAARMRCGAIAAAPILQRVSVRSRWKATCLLANKAHLAACADVRCQHPGAQPTAAAALTKDLQQAFDRLDQEDLGGRGDAVAALATPTVGPFVKRRAGEKFQRLQATSKPNILEEKLNLVAFGQSEGDEVAHLETIANSREVRGAAVAERQRAVMHASEELRKKGQAKRLRELTESERAARRDEHTDLLNLEF